MHLRRRENEPINAFLYRFNKKIRQSGILIEAKKRKHRDRPISKNKRKISAFYRVVKRREIEKAKKFGSI